MYRRENKFFFFVFEALGSLACGFYGNYVFFLLRDRYGFGNVGNLGMAALQGLIWALASWQGGRFAQRFGYYTGLRAGLLGMGAALLAGVWLEALTAQISVLVMWTASTCFVWPALEALVSEGETDITLPRQLGIYNVVWAACSACSYFLGGAVFDHLGIKSIFWLPIGVYLLQYAMVARFPAQLPTSKQVLFPSSPTHHQPEAAAFKQNVSPRTFLRMAWLANPFACIGINTLLATIPALARDLHLSTTASGLFCSVWFFARLAAFVLLWQWRGWHYRFCWLIGAFLGLMAGFVALLMLRDLWLLFAAQVLFGFSIGLIYYSSLFYSMDVGQTKGEHGGLHEAAMGAGNFLGPALGMSALVLVPQNPNAGVYAVGGLLGFGLMGLFRLRFSHQSPPDFQPAVSVEKDGG